MAHQLLHLEDAKINFQVMSGSLMKDDLRKLIKWIGFQYGYADEASKDDTDDEYGIAFMQSIVEELKKRIPFEGILSSEKSVDVSKKQSNREVHVDAFLYDDEALDDLVEDGKLSRYYCCKCGSTATKPFTFISHSLSLRQMRFLLKNVNELVPQQEQKIILDVGSRLGAVLYGAHVWTSFRYIIGIEINPEFCKLQEDVARKFCMDQRIAVICSDIRDQSDVLQRADVVILHNVFQYFFSEDEQAQIWLNLRSALAKKGALLVTVPSLEESLSFNSNLLEEVDVTSWVEPVNVDYGNPDDLSESCMEDMQSIYFYRVL